VRDLLHALGHRRPNEPPRTRSTRSPTRATVLVKAGRRASTTAAQRYYAAFRQVEGIEGTVVVHRPGPT
jgi:hypothetical protein